uniref:Uncharacterized protein n=1 Tax=Cuerna arida TaxID=1464854 RepID=A0A1B6EYE4_9HEMI
MRSKLPVRITDLQPKLVDQNIYKDMVKEQNRQQTYYNRTAVSREDNFQQGEKVLLQDIDKKTWEEAEIVKALENRSYLIKKNSGQILRRNSHHIRRLARDYNPKRYESLDFNSAEPQQTNQTDNVLPPPMSPCEPSHFRSRFGRCVRPPVRLDL